MVGFFGFEIPQNHFRLIFQNPVTQKYIIESKQRYLTWDLKLPIKRKTDDCHEDEDAMKSAEFGKFPCHITLPNTREPFWWKESVSQKVLSLMRRKFTSLNHSWNLLQNERTTVLPQSRPFHKYLDISQDI